MSNATNPVKLHLGPKTSRHRWSDEGPFQPITYFEEQKAQELASFLSREIKPLHCEVEYLDHGYRSGILHESNLWQIAANVENPRPFSVKEYVEIPKFHLGILVDCSGSMHCADPHLKSQLDGFSTPAGVSATGGAYTVMHAARILCCAFGKALSGKQGITLTISGHTEEGGAIQMILVKRADTDFEIEKMGNLNAQAGNIDGVALKSMARLMQEKMGESDTGLIVLICDGAPCHSGAYMKSSIQDCKSQYNIGVCPILVGSAGDSIGKEYYGEGRYMLAPDVVSAAPSIATRVNRLIEELKPM
jgi:hypothetical protein